MDFNIQTSKVRQISENRK